jgi:hypothetical protein
MQSALYNAVEKLLSSLQLSKYKTIIRPLFGVGVKRLRPSVRKEPRLRVFKNRVLNEVFVSGRMKSEKTGEHHMMRFINPLKTKLV